jgi:catechol 2,3-dioxygenase-like lactoylglutathione lyase family enzyme
MITRLSLVTILVHDQEEALRWFTEILGLKKLQDANLREGIAMARRRRRTQKQ